MRTRTDGQLVAAFCAAEVLGMAATMTFPALLPQFLAEWRISNTEAGWANGIFYAGYAVAVSVLVSLTDRIDPRRVYLVCTALSGVAALGFALFAEGLWTAMAFRALGGVALAGTYMPGLRILSDRLSGPRASRYFAFYTASFSIGSGASVLLAGLVAEALGWRWAFAVAAACPLLALGLAAWAAPADVTADRDHRSGALLDFRPVLRNRPAMGYVLGYAIHCVELFGFRSWLVAFLSVAALAVGGPAGTEIAWIATVILLLGVPASILGNEIALRLGRLRVIGIVMLATAVVGAAVGFMPGLPFALVVIALSIYGFLIMMDSAALTVGAVTSADPALKGATLAVHAMLGFGGAFVGPLLFGAVLDLSAGRPLGGWGFAFASLSLVVLLGPLALRWSHLAARPNAR